MAKKKLKLFLLVICGLFVFGIGCIFAKKYNQDNQNSNQTISSFFNVDSDNDGLSDLKEKELGTNPYLADSDSDGFNDKQELDSKHDPLKAESNDFIDQDNDGLIGLDEKKYGTDPNKSDSDYDGYPDGEEIANGFDPKIANLSSIKNILSQIPKDQKEQAKQVTGLDLTSTSSIDSLENLLNSNQSADLQKYADQIVNSSNQQLILIDVKESEISILKDAPNSDNVASYVESFNNNITNNLSFLLSAEKQDALIQEYGNLQAAKKISESFQNCANDFKKTNVPNDSEFVSLHKQFISVFETLSQKYDIIANAASQNMPAMVQALSDILRLNTILYDQAFVKIQDLNSQYY